MAYYNFEERAPRYHAEESRRSDRRVEPAEESRRSDRRVDPGEESRRSDLRVYPADNSRRYDRDRSMTRYETARPDRPSIVYGNSMGGRSSNTIYHDGGRASHTTSEATPRARSPARPLPYQESQFPGLENIVSRRGGSNVVTRDEPGRRSGSHVVTLDPRDRGTYSRHMIEEDSDRHAGSRFVVEEIADRRAGSRYVTEDDPDRRQGSRYVTEEDPDRRQGSRYVMQERPSEPYGHYPDPRYPWEVDYTRVMRESERQMELDRLRAPEGYYQRREPSAERYAPAERDQTRQRYVVNSDRYGGYQGLQGLQDMKRKKSPQPFDTNSSAWG